MAGKYTLDQNGARIQSILNFFEGYTFDSAVNFPQYILNTLADTTDNKTVSANRINLNNLYIKSGSYYCRIFSGGVNPSDPFSTGYLDFITNDTGASGVIAGYGMRYDAFAPLMNEGSMESPDLGTRTTRWRDLYLKRNLTDGQYSITIAQLFNMYTNYLSRSAGPGNYLTGTLFSNVNDINFIGTQGKIGFRAYKTGTTDNAGQMLITADNQVEGSYRLSIQAWNNSANGYNTLRMGDSEGLTYKLNDNILFHIDNNGRATIGSDPVNDLDVATKQYVDNSGGTKLYRHTLKKDYAGIIFDELVVVDNNSEKLTYSNWNSRRASMISTTKSLYLIINPPYCEINKLYTLGVEFFGSFGNLSQIEITFDDDEVTPL